MLWWEGHPYILEFCGSLAMFHGRKASLPAAQECVELRPNSHPVTMIYRTLWWFLSTPSHYDPSQCRRRWPSSEGEETTPPAADSRPTVPRTGLYFHVSVTPNYVSNYTILLSVAGEVAQQWRKSIGCFWRGPRFDSHMVIHEHLSLWFQGIHHPLLASTGTAHTWYSNINAGKHSHI